MSNNINAMFGASVLLVAFAVTLKTLRFDDGLRFGSDSRAPDRENRIGGIDARASGASQSRVDGSALRGNSEYRNLEISPTNPRYLDWSLAELERFLDEQSSVISDSEMKSLIRHLLPDPPGSQPRWNRLQPGSISVADQARICLKFVEPNEHVAIFSTIWSRHRDCPDSEDYLAQVASQMEQGHLRQVTVRGNVSYYFSDYSRIENLLVSEKPMDNLFPGFIPIGDDQRYIVEGLQSAFLAVLENRDVEKMHLIDLIMKSKFEDKTKVQFANYLDKWAR
jgi:hypothetical protein